MFKSKNPKDEIVENPPSIEKFPLIGMAFRNSSPFLISAWFFGLLFGFTGASLNFTFLFICSLSLLVNSGSVQFLTIVMISEGEPIFAVFLTALFINLRLAFYGASLRNMFELRTWEKLLWPYFILDESFIATTTSQSQLQNSQELPTKLKFIFLYAGIFLTSTWNIATLLGYWLFSSVGSFLDIPNRLIIAASFVGFLALHWQTQKQDRILLVILGILSIITGFFISSSTIILMLMIIAVVLKMITYIQNSGDIS